MAVLIFIIMIIILIGIEKSKNNYRYSEINRKIEENRAMNTYLLSQTETIKEYLSREGKNMLNEELMNDVSQIDDSRIIFFYAEEITLDNSSVLIKELIRLDMESDDDIYLFLQTLGGDLYNSFAIYDTINSLKAKVNIVCFATCYSGGVLIAAAGEKVYAFQHTDFLVHPVQLSYYGALDDLTHINDVSDKYIDAISKELNISNYDFKIKYDKDIYLSAHDMLNAGIVDEVVTNLDFLRRKGVN